MSLFSTTVRVLPLTSVVATQATDSIVPAMLAQKEGEGSDGWRDDLQSLRERLRADVKTGKLTRDQATEEWTRFLWNE
jgi:hypothetical protein